MLKCIVVKKCQNNFSDYLVLLVVVVIINTRLCQSHDCSKGEQWSLSLGIHVDLLRNQNGATKTV